jgi:trypsin
MRRGHAGLGLVLAALAATPAHASTPRIVGGTRAGVYPAQAEVDVRAGGRTYLCGGTLVHGEWVLTAAHCVAGVKGRSVTVRLGSTELGKGRRHRVDRIVRAPGWTGRTFRHDAALLHLRKPSRALPLPITPSTAVGGLGRVLGWGTTSEDGQPSPDLQQVDVPIAADVLCSTLHADFDPTAMLCAGYGQGGKDACQGDSGGPIMIDSDLTATERWGLAGIVSTGSGCARPGQLGVYTDLSDPELLQWLTATAVHRRMKGSSRLMTS